MKFDCLAGMWGERTSRSPRANLGNIDGGIRGYTIGEPMGALASALLLSLAATPFDAAMGRAVALYNDAEWDAALRELTIAERLATDDGQRVQVWLHQGIMLANVPDAAAAKAAWRRALEVNLEAELPLAVSPRVKTLFQEAKQAAEKAAEDAPKQRDLTPQPGDPRPQLESQTSFPIVPVISLGAALAAGGVGLGFALSANAQLAAARDTIDPMLKEELRGRAGTHSMIANIAFVVAGAAALAALITFIVLD
jgi:hypothetical protein